MCAKYEGEGSAAGSPPQLSALPGPHSGVSSDVGPLYGCSSRPLSDMQRPRLPYADPPRARSSLHRVESDGLAAAAAFAAASFFAVIDTHRPKMFVLSCPFPAFVVNVVT